MAGSPAGDRRDRVRYRTGTPWLDLPEHFGSWTVACSRLRFWAIDGTWERVFAGLLAQATPRATSTVSSRSTPRSSVPTSTPPGPVKTATATGRPSTSRLSTYGSEESKFPGHLSATTPLW
ncbi:transposase [Streptomyces sp. NPDC058734]|uniref:transposase n=1 Tax=Streptomyces sp. NPDC058734 TaxID=3346615 RepID=UPI0036A88C4C